MNLDLVLLLESNALKVIILHFIISLLLAIILSGQIIKRYVTKSKELREKDLLRFQEFKEKTWFHKWMFKISLHKNNEYASLLFIFLYNFSIPIIGYFSSVWMTWYLLHVKYEKKISKISSLNLDEFKTSFLQMNRMFGEGAMNTLITNKYKSTDDKLFALTSLSKLDNIPPENLRIIRQALTSKDDEVRLFGYAIINKEEMKINAKINKNIALFQDKKSSDEQRAIGAKELAFLYWDLIYKELSHESLKANFLSEVVKYLNIAKSYFFSEIEKLESLYNLDENKQEKLKQYKEIRVRLYILMGRVHMYNGEYEKAVQEFSLAQELNENDSSFIMPYLAEVYFLSGKYSIVKSILNSANDLELNAKLFPIVDQWKVDKMSVA